MSYNKYRNKKTIIDGIKFDSMKEASRYSELKIRQKMGAISDLKLQPKFEICPSVKWNGKTLRKRFYIADFKYTLSNGLVIVEDVKSEISKKISTYTLKKQLFLVRYPAYLFIET